MGLWVCRRCTAKFAVGLSCCPQCTGTNVYEDGNPDEEDEMAKTTVHGGATNVAAGDNEGGEQSSPGTSSEASTSKPPTNGETNEADHPKPAQTTGRSSSKGKAGSSSARSTGGSTRATGTKEADA